MTLSPRRYERLRMGKYTHAINHALVTAVDTIGVAPKVRSSRAQGCWVARGCEPGGLTDGMVVSLCAALWGACDLPRPAKPLDAPAAGLRQPASETPLHAYMQCF
jgi:hypothetical protein